MGEIERGSLERRQSSGDNVVEDAKITEAVVFAGRLCCPILNSIHIRVHCQVTWVFSTVLLISFNKKFKFPNSLSKNRKIFSSREDFLRDE